MKSVELEALESLLAQTHAKKHMKAPESSFGDTDPGVSHIDVTDQYAGKSLIITGVAPLKKAIPDAERDETPLQPAQTTTQTKQPTVLIVMSGMSGGKGTMARKLIREE